MFFVMAVIFVVVSSTVRLLGFDFERAFHHAPSGL
jgi:hypothetical protein